MTVRELLDVVDYNRESTIEKIEVCRPSMNWEDVDEVGTSSALLIPLYDARIVCMAAVAENVIRIDIEWDKVIKHES